MSDSQPELPEPLDVTNLAPGTLLLGKYRTIETLGVGGMGVVVAAEHTTLQQKVAMKFLLPQLTSNENIAERFVREARAATKIQSEHVARVIDVGTLNGPEIEEEDGIPYMVMEYLEGKDLSQWCRMGKRFSVEEACDFLIQAAEALAQAHRVGIIHRDIKPANLFLVERDGTKTVKVLDFGISKMLDEEPQEMGLTKTTTVLGSGLYMSPEQMRSAKNVDIRTDVYALGVCLYELLTGTQPFTAETFSELCVKVNIDPPTPLRQHRPDISDEFAEIAERAYAREPADRYQNMGEVVAALSPYATQASVPVITTVMHITGVEMPALAPMSMVPPGSTAAPRSAVAPRISTTPPPPSSRAYIPGTSIMPAAPNDPTMAGAGMGDETSLAGTQNTLTAEPPPPPVRHTGTSVMLILAVVGLVFVAGAGVYVLRGSNQQAATAATAATTRPTGESAPTSSVVDAEPSASATATATATATASASGAAPLATTYRPPVRPPVTAAPPPTAPPPPKMCAQLNPTTGLRELVPCN